LSCYCVGYKSGIKALPVLGPNEGLQLMAIVDHMDGDEERESGDLWQLEGPLTYKPTPYAVCFSMQTVELYRTVEVDLSLVLFVEGCLLIKTPC